MELLINANVTSRSAMGEHRTISQADPVVMLFDHGAYDETA